MIVRASHIEHCPYCGKNLIGVHIKRRHVTLGVMESYYSISIYCPFCGENIELYYEDW